MLLTWVALVLTSTLSPNPIPDAHPIPIQPSVAIAAKSENPAISPIELQALRIRALQFTTPPLLSAVQKLPAPAALRAKPFEELSNVGARYPSRQMWVVLAVGQHAGALFDAWSTRTSLQTSHTRELDPLVRPFSHSAAVYPALQVVPTALDFLSRKMMRSPHPLFRKSWWIPQTVAMTAFVLSGAHNLRLAGY